MLPHHKVYTYNSREPTVPSDAPSLCWETNGFPRRNSPFVGKNNLRNKQYKEHTEYYDVMC